MSRLAQRRAAFALERVEGLLSYDAGLQGKYKTQLLKLPARLHTNGFGQTVAFYLSAGQNSPETVICDWLQDWLRQAGIYPQEARLIDCVTGAAFRDGDAPDPHRRYRQASAEARALANWLKRFAEAFIAAQTGGSP